MLIMNALQAWVKTGCFIGWIALLTACGGSSKKAEPDTTPNAFSFAAVTNAEPGTTLTSAPVTIAGINAAAPISITGGAYAINGGTATSTPGTITNGQSVVISLAAAETTHTATSATLTIGGVGGVFTVTTLADTTPDAFSFDAIIDVEPGSVQTSNAITVTGIDIAVPISITGGEYAIGEGEYTSEAGTVANDQTVTVRVTAAAGNQQTTEATLTIGGITATYSVTTFPDTQAPTAAFVFPPPMTMSEANSVIVRGTASDYNQIARVQIKVNDSETLIDVTPTAEGDYSSWTATVPLTTGIDNQIVVVAEDEFENVSENAAAVVIRQAPLSSAFPDEVNQFVFPEQGLVIDKFDGRNRLLVQDYSAKKIYSVDIATGQRSIFIDLIPLGLNSPWGLTIDPVSKHLFGLGYSPAELIEFSLGNGSVVEKYSTNIFAEARGMVLESDGVSPRLIIAGYAYSGIADLASFSLDTKEFSLLSDDAEQTPALKGPRGIALDAERNRYLVTVGGQDPDANNHLVLAVDRTTGVRTVFSGNLQTDGPSFSAEVVNSNIAVLTGVALDAKNNRLLVNEKLSDKIFAIDLTTGTRSIFMDTYYANQSPNTIRTELPVIDDETNTLFINERGRKAILVVDLITRSTVILSKSAN